jgi:methionyl-tRNA synthetase
VNIASRTAAFVHKHFGGKLAATLPASETAAYAGAAHDLSRCAEQFNAGEFAAATRDIIGVADAANAYVAANAPWNLAKDESKFAQLHTVCTLALNYFRLLSVYLAPIVPAAATRALALFNETPTRFDAATQPLLGTAINEFSALAARIDTKKVEAMIEASKESLQSGAAAAAPEAKKKSAKAAAPTAPANDKPATSTDGFISIEDFAKLDLRIGKVVQCGFVDGSDKLLRFELDAGPLGKRQIFSGIRAAYAEPEKLIGRNVVFIANLAPRKMRFGVSEGMILSAGSGDSDLFLLDADPGAKPGDQVK